MIEKILGVRLEISDVKVPSAQRNGNPELALLVAFAFQRKKAESLLSRYVEDGSANRQQRRRLVITAIETMQRPPQLRQDKLCPNPRIHRRLAQSAIEMRKTQSTVEFKP